MAAAVVAVVVHWYRRRLDALGRRRAFPVVSLLLLGALAISAAAPGVLRLCEERRLAGVASALAGRQVAVRCQSFGGAFVDAGVEFGYVRWRADGTVPAASASVSSFCCLLMGGSERCWAAWARGRSRLPRPV